MTLPVHLAMTAAELACCDSLPSHPAWMACHFSPYGTGLSNLPERLPEGALLILNDRTPVCGHDPQVICAQLHQIYEASAFVGLLLDFQRPSEPQTRAIAQMLTEALPFPVCVSECYADGLNCPVLLPPVPMLQRIEQYIAPWKGREVWLELALDASCVCVTESGSHISSTACPTEEGFFEPQLLCHYRTQTLEQEARFTLWRTAEDLTVLIQKAAALGITRAVGLYQELHGLLP